MSIKLLRIAAALFFILLGLAGLLPHVEESIFSLNNRNMTIEILFGVVELVAGVVLLLGLFSYNGVRLLHTASLVILIFWIARIVLSKLIWSNPAGYNLSGLFQWFLVLSVEALVAAALWVLVQAYHRKW